MQLAVCASEVGSTVGECCMGSVLRANFESGWGGAERGCEGMHLGKIRVWISPTSAAPCSQSVCLLFHPLSSLLLFSSPAAAVPRPSQSSPFLFVFPSFHSRSAFFLLTFPLCCFNLFFPLCVSVFLPLFTFLVAGSPSGVSAELTLWTPGRAVFAETVVFQPEETFSPASQ